MSIVKMKRVALIGLDIDKQNLMDRLMDFGMLEITDQSSKMQDELWANSTTVEDERELTASIEGEINRAQAAFAVIEKYGGLKTPFFQTRRSMNAAAFDRIKGSESEALNKIDFILQLQEDINHANDSINIIEQDMYALASWEDYDIPLEVRETASVRFDLGMVPGETNLDELTARLEDEIGTVLVKSVLANKDFNHLAIASLKAKREELFAILKEYGFTHIVFGKKTGTVAENLKLLQEEREEELRGLKVLKKTIVNNASVKEIIEDYIDGKTIDLDKEKIKEKLLSTQKTFFIEGWVPVRWVDRLTTILEATGCYYQIRDPEEEEQVPVLLKNSRFFTPIEAVTEMYSLPDYHGFDPTSIYALFYICFFGMMFSDAGYGLLLAGGCFAVLKKFNLEGNMYRMVKMFMYCGISTIFWGAMFGGFFGDLISSFSGLFLSHEIVVPALWFNPLDDPMKLLIFSLVLGVVHLFIGMGINAYMEIRDGKPMDALFNEGAWYVTLPGLAMLLGSGTLGIPILSVVGKWMSIAGVAMLIVGGARGKKGIGRLTGAFSNVYSITSWMSDILSYARLLALGLATGVIAQVVNVMGSLFGGGIGGMILFILIFTVGTVINFAINVLGSFIHSARLQYVEFFGKFYRDGGDPFRPFKKNTKYVRVEEEKR